MKEVLKRWYWKKMATTMGKYVDDKVAQQIKTDKILENPYLSAKKLSPLEENKGYFIVPKAETTVGTAFSDTLPLPPKAYWEGYGDDSAAYLSLGREHMGKMIEILGSAGARPQSFKRVLDFGCAGGRMLRFFPYTPGIDVELWGVDLKAAAISWCQQHFPSPFRFATNTTAPHLPFEDNYFDLVYAGSVFTHIADLPDTWLLELRRVLRAGGYAYITIMDKRALKTLFEQTGNRAVNVGWYIDMLERFNNETNVFSMDYACFSVEGGRWGGFPVPQVIYDLEYLVEKWSLYAKVISVNHEAYGFQTALLLQKRGMTV